MAISQYAYLMVWRSFKKVFLIPHLDGLKIEVSHSIYLNNFHLFKNMSLILSWLAPTNYELVV